MDRRAYAKLLDPTVGDRVHLADAGYSLKSSKDFTTEVKFGGGGKNVRDGMDDPRFPNADGAVDLVITNA